MPETAADLIHRAGEQVAARYAPFLRQAAVDAGWPENVARRISMTVSQGHITATFDGAEAMPSDIEALEYGDGDNPPRSVIGNFFNSKRQQQEMSAEFRRYLAGLNKKFDNALRGRRW